MKPIFFIAITMILSSCQFSAKQREPSSYSANDMKLDPKFENYEGGSADSEEAIHAQLIGFSKELMERMYSESENKVMTRDAHAKSHGCLKARFTVDTSNLPSNHRKGLFRENKSYDAWVRFSNNDHLPMRKDNEYDLRGMAIKVMGVEGEKIMAGKEDASTQDFLMYGSKIFFVKNNADYIGFIRGLRDDNAATVLLTEQPKAAVKTRLAQWKVSGFTNPLNMPYHSALPIRLGAEEDKDRAAMKYGAVPCKGKLHSSLIGKKDPHYMRKNMKSSLEKNSACFDFKVQIQTDSTTMPIEDATKEWPESPLDYGNSPYSPYVSVARIEIPEQTFDTEERDRYCENLSITPWHALVEHKPLGRTMRMRRDVYKATSELRRQRNQAIMEEPSEFLID